MASKSKREKREQAFEERKRQLRTGAMVAAPAPQSNPPPRIRPKKVANDQDNSTILTFVLNQAEEDFRREMVEEVIANQAEMTQRMVTMLKDQQKLLERLERDEQTFEDKAKELFSQPEFSQYHFNHKVIDYIFQKIGGFDRSKMVTDPSAFAATLRKCIQVIPKGEISWLQAILLSQINSLIDEKRFEQAIILSVCFYSIGEEPKEANPFTLAMLMQGLDAYFARGTDKISQILAKMGLDRETLEAEGAPDIDSPQFVVWLKKKLSNKTVLAQAEQLFAADPANRKFLEQIAKDKEQKALNVFEQPDVWELFFSFDELEAIGAGELLKTGVDEVAQAYPGGSTAYERDLESTNKKAKANASKATTEGLLEIITTLARRLATPENMELLKAKLERYEHQKQTAGAMPAKEAAAAALIVVSTLYTMSNENRVEAAATNPFFNRLVGQSVQASLDPLMNVNEEEN